MKNQNFVVLMVAVLSFASISHACLWDYDTLEMERRNFPSAHELIVGKFVRHSPAYYQWRIEDRTSKKSESQTSADFDDIAVAYDKLGQHDKAIDTVKERMERWPDQRQYEAHANLGTFHIHAGRYEEGLVHISKAIEINPDAHFGREVYQKHLVEFMIQKATEAQQAEAKKFPTANFYNYLMDLETENQPSSNIDRESERAKAVKGVLGMMRFGNYDSPVLLEALGDLLSGGYFRDSKMLAARAYLRAAESSDVKRLREKAEGALSMQAGVAVADIESDLKREIKEGKEFYEQIVRDEQKWAAAGKNLDDKFASRYHGAEPQIGLKLTDRFSIFSHIRPGVAICLAGIALGVFILVRAAKERLRRPSGPATS